MLISFALEFDDEQALRQSVRKLWQQHGVRGEFELLPLGNGRWRLSVHSERQLRLSTLENLPGKLVKAPGPGGRRSRAETSQDQGEAEVTLEESGAEAGEQ